MKKIIAFSMSLLLFFLFCGAKQNNVEGMALFHKESGILISGSNVHTKMEMASTTKIATLITAILECSKRGIDIEEKHKIPIEAVGIEGSSIYLKENDEYSLLELFYGLMLRSGNDAAVAISTIISGTVEKFVVRMNEMTLNLGLFNTHFDNPHGLSSKNHYTTPYDLGKISVFAMKNPLFKKIVSSKSFNGQHCNYSNKNRMLFGLDGATGIKTGYTKNAGRCLVSSCERNGSELVLVVLNCPAMFEKSTAILSNTFRDYEFVKFCSKDLTKEIKVEDMNFLKQFVSTKNDITLPVKRGEKIQLKYKLPDKLPFGIKDESFVGLIEFYSQNNLIFKEKIYTIRRGSF